MKHLTLLAVVISIAAILVGCGTPATEVIEKEVTREVEKVVTQVVEETVIIEGTQEIVEIIVTATPEPVAVEQKTLVYVHPQEVRWLDPAKVTEGQSGVVVRNVYSRLLDQSYDASELYPDLAESWDISDDGLVYTFYLKEGIKFHDGTEMTSADVVYSYHRALGLNLANAVFVADLLLPENVVALDDLTVQMTLTKAWSPFLNIVAGPTTFSIVPKAWAEAAKTDDDPWSESLLNENANGTGPFTMVEWIPKQYVRLERFDGYHKGPAPIEMVLYQLSPDDTATRLALEKGDVDVVSTLPDDMMRVLALNPNVTVYNKPIASYMYWIFDCGKEPFTDKRVRQAFVYAIDYDAIMENLVKEGGVRMNSPILADMFGYDKDIPLIERDIEKSKQLLAEAGYADGLTIDMPYVVWGLIPDLAVVIQANLAEIGVTANLQEIPLNALMAGLENGEFEFFVWNSSPAYPHPDGLFTKLITSGIGLGLEGNLANYSNPELDQTVEKARAATTDEDQIATYKEAQRLVVEDAPWLLLYQESKYNATGAWVTGYDLGGFNYTNLWELDITR